MAPSPAVLLVAEVIVDVQRATDPWVTRRAQPAVKPIVQARTGASDPLYWRALKHVNATRKYDAGRRLV